MEPDEGVEPSLFVYETIRLPLTSIWQILTLHITIHEIMILSNSFLELSLVLPTTDILIVMKQCLLCQSSISDNRQFCSQKCSGQFREQQSISKWIVGKLCGHTGKTKKVKPFVRSYLFKKYNGACCKCGWNVPHPLTGIPVLESNHIDGNAENTIESNMELLCLNCHGLTLNFKNRNKGNGRRTR